MTEENTAHQQPNAEAIVAKLDELIAATRASNAEWLDAGGVGALLSQERSYVIDRLAPRPDFPKPMRAGQPRWKRSEILAWAEAMRAQSQPRTRKKAA